MSVKVMAAVWELDLPQNEKLVALCFADFADDAGLCFPSIDRIAWKTGYSRRQVQAIVQSLRGGGILVPVGDVAGGRGRPTMHRVCPEKGAKIAPFSGRGAPRERVQRSAQRVRPAARKGAVATAPEPSLATIEPPGNHQHTLGRTAPVAVSDPEGFAEFWRVYPRREARWRAVRAFRRIPHSELPKILAAVERWRRSDQWLREGGRYVPHAATFLGGRRWEDEIPAPASGANGGASRVYDRSRRNLQAAGFLP